MEIFVLQDHKKIKASLKHRALKGIGVPKNWKKWAINNLKYLKKMLTTNQKYIFILMLSKSLLWVLASVYSCPTILKFLEGRVLSSFHYIL